MKECFSQIPISLKKEKLILAIEETTSASERRLFFAAFSRPMSACPSDSVSQDVFLSFERSQRI